MVTGRQPCGTGLGTPWHPGFCRRLSHLALPCAHFSEKAGPGMGSGAEIPFPGLPSTSAQFQVRTLNAEGHPLWQWGHLRQQALALGPRPLSALESLLSFISAIHLKLQQAREHGCACLATSSKACADPAEGLDAKGELVSLAHPSPLSGPIQSMKLGREQRGKEGFPRPTKRWEQEVPFLPILCESNVEHSGKAAFQNQVFCGETPFWSQLPEVFS